MIMDWKKCSRFSATVVLPILLVVNLIASGCSSKLSDRGTDLRPADVFLTVEDDAGRQVTLSQRPQRIVVLATSFLDLLYAVGGKAVGRPSSQAVDIVPAARAATTVGHVYNINLEQVVALQPDLVIGFADSHDKLLPVLESNHIPVVLFKLRTLQDVVDKLDLLSRIVGDSGQGQAVIATLEDARQAVLGRIPENRQVKIAILHATAKFVTVELETSIAGRIAKDLGLVNVADSSPLLQNGIATPYAPYSLEMLVAADPNFIFIVPMGQSNEIEKRLKDDLESNPAWFSLTAVRKQNVHMLPSQLFLLNPGLRYAEAMQYMARLVYPEDDE